MSRGSVSGGGGTTSETRRPGEFTEGVLGDSMVADSPPHVVRVVRVEVSVTPISDTLLVASGSAGRGSKTTKRPVRGGDGGGGGGDGGGGGGGDGGGDGGAVTAPCTEAGAGSRAAPPAGRATPKAGSRPCAPTAYSAW